MSTNLIPFTFESNEIRATQDEYGNPWFVAKDVCASLNLTWSGATLSAIKPEWKGMLNFNTPGGNQELAIIREQAVYKLAFRSRKPEAEAFTDWVADTIATIRKTGHYELPDAAQTLLLSEQQTLSELIHAKARTAPDTLYRKAVSEIWSRFKNKFRVPRYADLPREHLTDAILYVNALELHCVKRLEADGTPPFLQGEIGTRLLIRLEGGGRYSVTPLGLTELVVDLADLVAIDQALDAWRDFAKRKELGYYRAGVANLRSNGH
jgi:prophage antirepressor-like protein